MLRSRDRLIRAPGRRNASPASAMVAGSPVDRPHVDELRNPAFDFATRTASGRGGVHLRDDRQELVRAVAAVAADRVGDPARPAPATACSGETPIIVWPRVSKVIVAMSGMPADAWRTPWTAARISERCDIVSIQITSTPPAMSAARLLREDVHRLFVFSVPSGAMISPVGPMSPATSARPPAASTSARRRTAAVRFSCVDPLVEAVEAEPEAIAAERVRHDDPRARPRDSRDGSAGRPRAG